MENVVFDFTPDGFVAGMYRDDFDVAFLGEQQVRRASEIVFINGKWDIYLIDEGKNEYCPWITWKGFAKYNEARQFEVKMLNYCRLTNVPPSSLVAKGYAQYLREKNGPEG